MEEHRTYRTTAHRRRDSPFNLHLYLSYLSLGILAWAGYKPTRVDTFETMHYWAYVAVFGVLMLHLVLKILTHVISDTVGKKDDLR